MLIAIPRQITTTDEIMAIVTAKIDLCFWINHDFIFLFDRYRPNIQNSLRNVTTHG